MQTAISRPIPGFILTMRNKDDIRFEVNYLGKCLIHTFRQPGDLYESWDIVPHDSNRAPDARYGPNEEPDPELKDFTPQHLWEVYQVWDRNGHTYSDLSIFDCYGNLLCHKEG